MPSPKQGPQSNTATLHKSSLFLCGPHILATRFPAVLPAAGFEACNSNRFTMANPRGGDALARARMLQKRADAVILPSVAKPKEDLSRERAACSFDSYKLACELHGGAERVARRAELAELASKDPLFDKTPVPHLSREQRYLRGAKVTRSWPRGFI